MSALSLLCHQSLLFPLLLLSQPSLLLLKFPLCLQLSLLLCQQLGLLAFLQYSLLLLVLPVLPVLLILPEVADLIGLLRLGSWRRGGLALDLLLRSGRQGRRILVIGKKVGWVLRQLGNGDQAGEVSEIGALVVKLDQSVMLGVISSSERLQGIIVASSCATSVS